MRGGNHGVLDLRAHHLSRTLTLEGRTTGKQVLGDASQRVQVAAVIELPIVQYLFGGHERGSPTDGPLAVPTQRHMTDDLLSQTSASHRQTSG
jgi:hypothetical protein